MVERKRRNDTTLGSTKIHEIRYVQKEKILIFESEFVGEESDRKTVDGDQVQVGVAMGLVAMKLKEAL